MVVIFNMTACKNVVFRFLRLDPIFLCVSVGNRFIEGEDVLVESIKLVTYFSVETRGP
jgi:hypothetical protein